MPGTDEIASRAYAIAARDWHAVRLLLHPYPHRTGTDGRTVRGRTNVMAMLEQATDAPGPPSSVKMRDGQIYRWNA